MNSTVISTSFYIAQTTSNISLTTDEGENSDLERTLLKMVNIFVMVIYSLAFVFGVIGNGMVIFVISFRMKKTVSTIWFCSLALADFIFTLFLPLSVTYIALEFHWPFGYGLCRLSSALSYRNLYASVYLLTVITIDRCVCVRYPVWAQSHRTPKRASLVGFFVWALTWLFCYPSIHFKNTASFPGNENVISCYNHYGNTLEQIQARHRIIVITRFIFSFIIPFSVIAFCYGLIVLQLRSQESLPSGKPFRVISTIIVVFFVCWFPYHVFSFLELNSGDHDRLPLVVVIGVPLTSSLAFINSCLNPFLYIFLGWDSNESLRYSLFSALKNAFTEESSQIATTAKASSSSELDIKLFRDSSC